MYGVTALGFGPLLYCVLYYCGDVWRYLSSDVDEDDSSEVEIELWQVSIVVLFNSDVSEHTGHLMTND